MTAATSAEGSPRPGGAVLVGLALVTACTLANQVVVTRLMAAVLAYHFSFLAVSVAMLGTGVGALAVYARPEWFADDDPRRLLARWTSAFALALVATPLALVRLDFSGVDQVTPGFVITLVVACVLLTLPALASGIAVALAIDRYRAAIGPVYAADLLGAGAGALLVVPTLSLAPAPELMVALGIVSSAAALLFSSGDAALRRQAAGLAIAGLATLGVARQTTLLYVQPGYKVPPGSLLVGEHWTPLARCFGYELPPPSSLALLFYDRVYAPIPIVKTEVLPTWKELRTGAASVGFAMTGPGRALIIGGGGGRDIYNALSSGQRPVDVIELIDGNRRIVDEDLGYLSGKPYSRDGVSTTIGDGRSVLAARTTKYDQIHLGFTDTLTANSAQGFALTEQNIYTVEAFEEYFDHLTPRGLLNVSRLLKLVGDEALRITVLTLAALEKRGVEDPFRHVVVVGGTDLLGPPTGTVLARLEPFTDEEVARLHRLANERANGLLMAPGGPNQLDWKTLAEAPSLEAFCNAHRLDVCPPTDDKPFFFNMDRPSQLGTPVPEGYFYSARPMSILLLTLLVLTGLSVGAFAVPLRYIRTATRPRAAALTYFGAIGLGFMCLEIVLIQRFVLFLGFPTYALSVVLFSLLCFAGLGSFWCSRLGNPRRALVAALGVATLLIGAAAVGLGPLLRAAIDLTFVPRVLITLAVIAPFGITLGMAMPIGLDRLASLHPGATPYAWGVNGIASVIASVVGMLVAIQFGFGAAMLLACGFYGFAWAHAAFGAWPVRSAS